MNHVTSCLKILCGVSVLSWVSASSHASGFDQPNQDAFAIGRGQAFVATANNPSAVYYNPAGITQLTGNNVRFGGYGTYIDQRFTSTNGGAFDNQNRWQGFPQFYYTYGKKNCPINFGLGVYSPFGFNVKWPQDTGFRSLFTEGQLNTITVNPVVAFKLFPELSIGGGVMIDYANLEFQRGIGFSPTEWIKFSGDDWAGGYNLGALWQPVKQISIGATFRSSATMDYRGHTMTSYPPDGPNPVRRPAYAQLPLPLEAVVGISYRPTSRWNLEFNADYTDWSALDAFYVQEPSIASTSAIPLNWQPSWNYEFGVTRYFEDGWHVSAGYVYSENSVPDTGFIPLVADASRHFISIGAGYQSKYFDFDVAYQFAYSPTRTISGSPPSPVYSFQTSDGSYDYMSQMVAVSVGMHF